LANEKRGEEGKEPEMPRTLEILTGKRFPAGATWSETGVNFSIFSPGTDEAEAAHC
jgi:hypothetical protein